MTAISHDPQAGVRAHILDLLSGENAHAGFESAVAEFPVKDAGVKPPGSPHSPWQLLEHLRIAQRDILDFSRNPQHASPKFPDGYWPSASAPPNDAAWNESVESFHEDFEEFEQLVADPANDLTKPIPHAPEGQTLLREALVLADHTSYHLGQFILLRNLLGNWKS